MVEVCDCYLSLRLTYFHHLFYSIEFSFIKFSYCFLKVRRSLKIRGRRKEKEKLPSGITADYSAEFFAHLPKDDDNEKLAAKQRRKINIDNNVDSEHLSAHSFSYSDSSETSLNSSGNKVTLVSKLTGQCMLNISIL